MARFVLLLPLNYNDKTKVPRKILNRIFDDIFALAGGYRIGGAGRGAYRMKTGRKQVDVTQEIWVVVPEKDEPALRKMIAGFARLLDQESIYLERVESTVEFIPPPADEDD